MPFLFLLLAVLVLFLGFPYFRCFFKRLSAAQKIKKLCRNKGYRFFQTHPFWFLGTKRGSRCDFYIETHSRIFAVKLFGMPKYPTVLFFKEDGTYLIRRYTAFISYGTPVRFPIDGKPQRMPTYDFRYRYRDAWEIKTPRRILLVNPICMEIRRQPLNGKALLVGAGEIVNGMEIESLSRLLGELENAR